MLKVAKVNLSGYSHSTNLAYRDMNGSNFLGWLKAKNERLRDCDADVISLAVSGVQSDASHEWFRQTLLEGSKMLSRMDESNEFGLPSLKAAIRTTYGIEARRNIVLTSGASGGLRLICEALLAGSSRSEVLVETPTYEPLVAIPARFGATIVQVQRGSNLPEMDIVAQLTRKLSEHTRAIFLSNIHNPSGDWLSNEQLARIGGAAKQIAPECAVVVDETFSDLGPSPGTTAGAISPNIITINSLSKCYGLGSLRCGWVTADTSWFPQLLGDWVLFENIGSKVLEILGTMAMENLVALRAAARSQLATNRELASEWFKEMREEGILDGSFPSYGCLLFPRWRGQVPVESLVDKLDHSYSILVAPGRFFGIGYEDHLRIGIGCDQSRLAEAFQRLSNGLRAASVRSVTR